MRETIALRGTVRMVLVPVALFGWAFLAARLLAPGTSPILSVFALLVLVAAFEAVHALHVGVERIGRFIQVYYERTPADARWETTAMRLGPGLPGSGIDPLFALLFISATFANLIVLSRSLVSAEGAVLLGLHVAFTVRIIRARLAAARQRARDLEIFQRVRAEETAGAVGPTV